MLQFIGNSSLLARVIFLPGKKLSIKLLSFNSSFKIIELHGRERCGEVDPAEIKTVARKNRLNELGEKVMYILDSLKGCALKMKTTEGLRKPRLGDKGMFL